MWITIDQIQCLKATQECGSITKASEQLHRAKSAINYSIKNLEQQLGFKVLDRTKYRPVLTPEGEQFLFKSKNILQEYNQLLEDSKQIVSGVEMQLAISGSGICSLDGLYKIIKKAMKQYPSTKITLHREILSGEKMLENNFVDIALFEELKNKDKYDYKIIDKLELLLIIHKDHPFLKLPKRQQLKKELLKYPQIIQRSTIQDDQLTHIIEPDGLTWSVTDTASKIDIIKNGLGWGRLPAHAISNELKRGHLTHLKHLQEDRVLDVYLCREKNKRYGKVHDFIWNSF